jgi:DNA-directed RNA polymerase subunit M/transcription elongation factor TFIIS
MTPFERPDRRCPKCEHNGYMFRGRRTVDGREDKGKFVETKYRCRSCLHEWWERIPAPPEERRDNNGNPG